MIALTLHALAFAALIALGIVLRSRVARLSPERVLLRTGYDVVNLVNVAYLAFFLRVVLLP